MSVKKFFLFLFFVLLSSTWFSSMAQQNSAVALAIRIDPTGGMQPGSGRISLFDASRHFSVILTNVGKSPVRLWKDWCSWGYFNLSFEMTDQNGRRVIVSRKMKVWEKNFPAWTTVAAGDQMVIDVTFDPAIWRNPPALEGAKERTISLRAIYESTAGKDANEHQIWTGKIASPENTYLLLR